MTTTSEREIVEGTGSAFSVRQLLSVRVRTRRALWKIADQISPGMTEEEGRATGSQILRASSLRKGWHKVLVRFGSNTTKNFDEPSEPGVVLGENDIFFIDIGPIFDGCEGDAGETVVVGDDPEMQRAASDVKVLWQQVRNRWLADGLTGEELYLYATEAARAMGWVLNLELTGHRLSEFPHDAHYDGTLADVGFRPQGSLWVLEIQIRHPHRDFGAFFEDLLLEDDELQGFALVPIVAGGASMCGVIGLLVKDPGLEPELGSMLVPMLGALGDRGPDSSGIAVYADGDPFTTAAASAVPRTASDDGPVIRVSLGSDRELDWTALAADLEARCTLSVTVHPFETGAVLRSTSGTGPIMDILTSAWPDVRVLGVGRAVSVVKDTGRPEETCRRYGIATWQGYMAVAHTRMATESAVTVLHSHPFVPAADLCVVHNGSFSNYASVRRRMMANGVVFDSDNDSEVAARFLAGRLAAGDDLTEATRWVMKEMDGFFTLVIATDTAMSVVRDAFACKPAVVAETEAYVAVASEYRALAKLPGIADADVFEPQPEEVYTWTR